LKNNFPLPAKEYIETTYGVKIDDDVAIPEMPTTFPDAKLNQSFVEGIQKLKIDYSIEGEDRLTRSHGCDLKDVHYIRTGQFTRILDIVLWPVSHDEVVEIVKLANDCNVVIIPFGGGTSISGSVTCPQNETDRCIASLDMSQMNRMLSLDKETLVARFEAGIIGQDLEKILASEGLTLGHEPDSYEFSTLGGWVATRASGMKKNRYGNIEDLVVQVRLVTSKGVLERNITAPRVSCGPDFNQIILGSEGSLGVITEVLVKVRPLPAVKRYGSIVFPDFESGIRCLREIAKKRCQPSSLRLLDNEQLKFGEYLKTVDDGFFTKSVTKFKKFILTAIKGYDLEKIAVATLVFEGDKNEVDENEKQIYGIAKKHGGLPAGGAHGESAYVSHSCPLLKLCRKYISFISSYVCS
jgi:alkyldihydroxyacetonephosphate synthase